MADVIEKEMVRVEKIEEQAEAKYEKNKASSKGMSKVCPVCYAVSSECARCAMLSRSSVSGVLCCLERVCPVCYAVSSECVLCAMLSQASVSGVLVYSIGHTFSSDVSLFHLGVRCRTRAHGKLRHAASVKHTA